MIKISNLVKKYNGKTVIDSLSLEIAERKHIAVMGPSGCGKTTLLRLIAGLEKPDAGVIEGCPKGSVSFVFQEPRLFPQLTARENISCVGEGEAEKTANELLARMGMSDSAEKLPAELSGGMAQRIAIARALAYKKPILLLDEPFKGLDGELKILIISLICEYSNDRTLILVTHDENEASFLCDSVYRFGNNMSIINNIKKS